MRAEVMGIEEVISDARSNVQFVDNAHLQTRIKQNPELLLLDVRTKSEFDAGHIRNAVWMERGVVEFRMARLEPDPSREIIVYCKVGNRSALVVKSLLAMGYRNVVSHIGFDDWVDEKLPFETRLGTAQMIKRKDYNAATNTRNLQSTNE